MIKDIERLLTNHWKWLEDKTILKQIGSDWVEITTPYLDRHNDCLQIYIRKDGSNFEITDDAYIITDLANSGCMLDTPKRQELLKTTLAGFGIRLEHDQLTVHATAENFSLKKHNMIQAMLAVNDLFYLTKSHVANLFLEDVTNWMELAEIRYTPKVKFMGKSGYDHMFDFVIPKSRQQPERIVQAITNPRKDSVEALVFKWLDTREIRSVDSKLFAFLNDSDSNIPPSSIDALRNYQSEPILWSQRDKAREKLAA